MYAGGSRGIRVRFEPPAQLNNTTMQMYRSLRIGRYSFMRSGIVRFVDEIGRYTSIGPGVVLGEGEHPIRWLTTSPSAYNIGRWSFYPPDADAAERIIRRDRNIDEATERNIVIGNDVWIGANVMVRRGVVIGDGAVVAGGAFVNTDVAPYSIVGGLPARVIGMRFDDDVITRLQALRWWEFDISDLAGVDFADVTAAMDEIEAREVAGQISRVAVSYNSVVLENDGYHSLKLHKDNQARALARLERLKRRRRQPRRG